MTNTTSAAKIRTRYAPSPTGQLHIGGARTALFNYLYAKQKGGDFILRFEDTDRERHVDSAESKQMAGLKWLGIDWNEGPDNGGNFGPYRQTDRLEMYSIVAQKLLDEGHAYYCFCSEDDLKLNGVVGYDGKCRNLSQADIDSHLDSGHLPAIRFKVPKDVEITFDDEIRGHVKFDSNTITDFIIVRNTGIPMYNFAAVVDDNSMEISHVIRGEEHLSNTPKQILLYKALGFDVPTFAHIPLILNADGKKMSKRDETTLQFVEQYKDLGYFSEATTNFLALLGWSPTHTNEILSMDDLVSQFDLSRVNKAPAIFDPVKFVAMNEHYIKNVDTDNLIIMSLPYLQKAGYLPEKMTADQVNFVGQFIKFHKHNIKKLSDVPTLAEKFYVTRVDYTSEAIIVLQDTNAKTILNKFFEMFTEYDGHTPETYKTLVTMVQTETGLKAKEVFTTIRAALIGDVHGLDIGQTIFLLGRDKVLNRIGTLADPLTSND